MVRTAKNLSNRTFSEMLELANRDKCESLRSRENWKPGHNLLNFAYLYPCKVMRIIPRIIFMQTF